MKVITQALADNLKAYQKICRDFKDGSCQAPDKRCRCRIWSEVWAHIQSVIPEPYDVKSMQDFNGQDEDGNQVLPPKMLKEARDALISYCWKGIEPGEDYDVATWLPRSIIEKRLEAGNNLIVYGDPWVYTNGKPFKKKMGRTLVAAIAMKEAIFQRIKPEHNCDSYAWVSYGNLVNRLMDQSKGNDAFNEVIANYASADWLVVDGFELLRQNEGGRAYRASVLEKFFGDRLESNRPNILVFQDDISKMDDLHLDFGNSIVSIVNSRKTHRVAMVDIKEEK